MVSITPAIYQDLVQYMNEGSCTNQNGSILSAEKTSSQNYSNKKNLD
jgi:hypothetical protein